IAEELPGVAHLANQFQIQIGHDQRVLIAGRLRDDLAARVTEVTLPIELADVPGLLMSHAIDRADEVAVGNRVRRLFQLPKIFGQPSHGGRGIENDLGAVQPERPGAFRKVAVVTDVDTDARVRSIESREAEIARLEIKFLPEPGVDVRNVVLAIFTEI